MKKKRIIQSVLALLALASCNKMAENEATIGQNDEIRLGTSGIVVETKAVSENTDATLKLNGFNAAVITDNDYTTIFNKKVMWSVDSFKVPGETYYYPSSGTVSAYGVYPVSRTLAVAGSDVTVSYTQNSSEDLIVAKSEKISKSSNSISLTFEHALAQVRVMCKGKDSNVEYVLKSIKFTSPANGVYSLKTGWKSTGTATPYTYYTNAGASVSTSAMQAFGESMTFIPGTHNMNVVWQCRNKGSHTVVAEYDRNVSVELEQGKKTTLSIVLKNDLSSDLDFSVDVDPFDENDKNIEI